jgi:hypothetical protein
VAKCDFVDLKLGYAFPKGGSGVVRCDNDGKKSLVLNFSHGNVAPGKELKKPDLDGHGLSLGHTFMGQWRPVG